jgi:hypothetical protein
LLRGVLAWDAGCLGVLAWAWDGVGGIGVVAFGRKLP